LSSCFTDDFKPPYHTILNQGCAMNWSCVTCARYD
jgi:hypothetical protein